MKFSKALLIIALHENLYIQYSHENVAFSSEILKYLKRHFYDKQYKGVIMASIYQNKNQFPQSQEKVRLYKYYNNDDGILGIQKTFFIEELIYD